MSGHKGPYPVSATLMRGFEDRLKSNLAELEAFLALLPSGAASADDKDKIRFMVHRLSGSGGTFGFPQVSTAAAAAEAALTGDGAQAYSTLTDLKIACLRALDELGGRSS